jgi:DNA (cytosine-5)-methyltransferase 1
VKKPILLDTFCKAGGCTKGYQRAGFYVVGVDIEPQPNYCGDEFYQADAIEFIEKRGKEFDVIHASPPCQGYSSMRYVNTRSPIDHPLLIDPVRNALLQTRKPYVIENVVGAPLQHPLLLCGSVFGLKVRRHRLFEMNFFMLKPNCQHKPGEVAVYGDHPEDAYVSGKRAKPGYVRRAENLEAAHAAMGIDWMTWREITQAIPPAYTEFIGNQLMNVLTLETQA